MKGQKSYLSFDSCLLHTPLSMMIHNIQAGLKYAIEEAEKYLCNNDLISQAKAKDKSVEPIGQALETKDETDKAQSIAILTKGSKRRSSKDGAGGKAGAKKGAAKKK